MRCEHCKKKFVTSKQLQKYPKHIQTCAFFSKFLKPLEQGISCLLCNNFTPNRTTMKIHIKSKHTKQELNEYVQNNEISFPERKDENILKTPPKQIKTELQEPKSEEDDEKTYPCPNW